MINIKKFYEEIKKHKIEDIICIDETSIKSLQKRNHCYSSKGKRCYKNTISRSIQEIYGYICYFCKWVEGAYEKSGINTDRLIEFLEKCIT